MNNVEILKKSAWINNTLELVKNNILDKNSYLRLIKLEAKSLLKHGTPLQVWKSGMIAKNHDDFWINIVLKQKITKKNFIGDIEKHVLPLLEEMIKSDYVDETLFHTLFFYFFQLPQQKREDFYLKNLSDLPLAQSDLENLIPMNKSDSQAMYRIAADAPQNYSRYYHYNLHTYLLF